MDGTLIPAAGKMLLGQDLLHVGMSGLDVDQRLRVLDAESNESAGQADRPHLAAIDKRLQRHSFGSGRPLVNDDIEIRAPCVRALYVHAAPPV